MTIPNAICNLYGELTLAFPSGKQSMFHNDGHQKMLLLSNNLLHNVTLYGQPCMKRGLGTFNRSSIIHLYCVIALTYFRPRPLKSAILFFKPRPLNLPFSILKTCLDRKRKSAMLFLRKYVF